jgi:hypothetical protein
MASQPPPNARVQQGQAAAPGAEARWKEHLAKQREEFQKVVDEANATLRALRDELRWEQRRRGEVEAELENLKKGSVAMMKYVTNLQRKKHDEEVEDLKRLLRERRGESAGGREESDYMQKVVETHLETPRTARAAGAASARSQSEAPSTEGANDLDAREMRLEAREREIEEQFQRLKEERQLRRHEVDSTLSFELGQLPEMQRLIVERDDAIKELLGQLDEAHAKLNGMAAALRRDANGKPLSFAEIDRARDEVDAVLVRQRHQLRQKDEEMARMKADFQTKMRNTIALQRIKYEQEIEALRRDAGKGRRRRRR